MKPPFSCFLALIFCALALTAAAQTKPAVVPNTAAPGNNPAAPITGETDKSLPTGYRALQLGMTLDAVKEQLLADSIFGYRGDRDVSLLPTMNRSLIETSGSSFITRSWFQFFEDKLYIMTLNLDPEKSDYYSVYSSLVSKYGEPVSLDPHRSIWTDGKITLSLERPLTVKYVDTEVFNRLLDESGTEKAAGELLREMFIDEF